MHPNHKFAGAPSRPMSREGKILAWARSCRARSTLPRYRHIADIANRQLQCELQIVRNPRLISYFGPISCEDL